MKFCSLFVTAMMAASASSSVSAFAPTAKVSSSSSTTTALKQSIDYNPGPPGGGFAPNSAMSNDPVDATLMNMVRYILLYYYYYSYSYFILLSCVCLLNC
jgi:exo-beta-1,3-glucanase (GH17 family)